MALPTGGRGHIDVQPAQPSPATLQPQPCEECQGARPNQYSKAEPQLLSTTIHFPNRKQPSQLLAPCHSSIPTDRPSSLSFLIVLKVLA
ncbi:hypothetical protein WAI453_010768 [Rhynchosporium graminicola]